jgi:hypothetical protein
MQKRKKSRVVSGSTKLSMRRMNKKLLLVFVLAFAAFGGYVIFRSFAATNPRLGNVFWADSPYFQHPAPGSDFTTEPSNPNIKILFNSVNQTYPQLLWVGPGATFKYYTNGSQTIQACFRVRDVGQVLYGPTVAASVTFSITNNGGSEVVKSQTVTLPAQFKDITAYGYNPYCITTGTLPNGKQFTNLQYRIVVNSGAIRVQSIDLHGIDFNYVPPSQPSNNQNSGGTNGGSSSPPAATPSTPSTGSGTAKPKVTVQGSGTVPVSGSIKIDSAAPSKPGNFKAESNPGDPGINLTWSASTDDVAVAAYKLERSSDGGKNWTTLTASLSDTSYFDYDTQFDTKYQYRLTAIDTSGNTSEPATAEATASSFQPNAGPDKSVSLHSDDNTVSVNIPEGALKNDAVCSVELDSRLGNGPNIKDYVQIGGPYNVICKSNDNVLVAAFEKPVSVSISTKDYKKYKTRAYYVKSTDKTDWLKIPKTTHNKKDNTDNFTVQDANSIVVLGKLKHTPVWVKLLVGLTAIGAMVFAFLFIARRIARKRLEQQYRDYYRKASGL